MRKMKIDAGNTVAFSTQSPLVCGADRLRCCLSTITMTKCAFRCCSNRNIGPRKKPGLAFYSFKDVSPAVRDQWIKIVARERESPNYKPNPYSRICAEHFAPYDITPSKTLYPTAIPTINIGPYDDTVLVDDDNVATGNSDLVCIIENQISTQPIIEQDDEMICVIENQISTKPKPQIVEQDVDIEDQIQWSMVGTSKHFNGLLHKGGLPTPVIPPQSSQKPITVKVDQKRYVDEDVIIVENDDSETKSEDEFKDRYSKLLKRPRKVEAKQIKEGEIEHEDDKTESETEKEFKDQYSRFLKTYDKNKYHNYKPSFEDKRQKLDRDKLKKQPVQVIDREKATPKTISTASKQFETTSQQPSLKKHVTINPIPQSPIQFETIPIATEQLFTTLTQQLIPTTPKQFVATTQQPVPVQLIEASQLTTPQLTTTPLLATTPQFAAAPAIATPVFTALPQTSTPLLVYDPNSSLDGKQLVTLVPSNFSVSGVQLSSVFLENNNIKTYYLSNVLPSGKLFQSDPTGESTVKVGESTMTQQCLTLNDNIPTNFIIKSEQGSEQFEPIILKTENVNDN